MSEAAVAVVEQGAAPEPKTKSGAQRRFDQLTKEKYEAKRQVESLRREVTQLQEALRRAMSVIQIYKSRVKERSSYGR